MATSSHSSSLQPERRIEGHTQRLGAAAAPGCFAQLTSVVRTRMVCTLLTPVAVVALVAGCNSPESARVEQTRTKLVGTWVRDAVAGNEKVQELIALGADGKFTDRLLLTPSDGPAETRTFGGEWSYDGTNLKRRYLQENGRQYAGGSMRYATFPLISISASELVIDNTIERQKVSYRKTSQGSQP